MRLQTTALGVEEKTSTKHTLLRGTRSRMNEELSGDQSGGLQLLTELWLLFLMINNSFLCQCG